MSEHQYFVFGCGGFGREVMPIMSNVLCLSSHEHVLRFMVSAWAQEKKLDRVNGYEVWTMNDSRVDAERAQYVIAVGNPQVRRAIHQRILGAGLHMRPMSLLSHMANVDDRTIIGDGLIACAHVLIHPNTDIGRHCHLNIYSYVAHDATLGDFVTLAPKAAVNGNCRVGSGAYIGTGAMLREGVMVGPDAVIGMGAVVLEDVPPGETWVGNPARRIK